MAEYINRDELELDAEWSEYYDGFTSYSQEQIQSAPTADVIERDEYDKLHQEYLKAIHRHTESLKELHELRSKIDKAKAQIEKLSGQSCSCSDGIIDEVLDILEEI